MNKKTTSFHVGYLFLAALGVWFIQNQWIQSQAVATIPYSEFQKLVREDKIANVVVAQDQLAGELKEPIGGKKKFVAVRVDADEATAERPFRLVAAPARADEQTRTLLVLSSRDDAPKDWFLAGWDAWARGRGDGLVARNNAGSNTSRLGNASYGPLAGNAGPWTVTLWFKSNDTAQTNKYLMISEHTVDAHQFAVISTMCPRDGLCRLRRFRQSLRL